MNFIKSLFATALVVILTLFMLGINIFKVIIRLCPNRGQKLPPSPSSSLPLIGLRLNFWSQLGSYGLFSLLVI
jgi:hypothetical protein